MSREPAVILGAGVQGVCAALALRHRGHRVTLIDKAPDCMTRASLRSEGKIHLGFVYAHDASFRTSSLMLRSALAFSPFIDRWLGKRLDWSAMSSRPFGYVIARTSMVPPDELFAHYDRLQSAYRKALTEGGGSYLGRRPAELWRETTTRDLHERVDARFAARGAETAELALDLIALRQILRAGLGAAQVETLYGHHVESVVRTPSGFRVEGRRAGGTAWTREAGMVVNCLWEGRLALDQQMELVPSRSWVYRLRYRLLGTVPPELMGLPSLSLVLGPYGDIVVYPSGRMYLSWYPSCLKGWCDEVTTPPAWENACDGRVDAGQAATITRETLEALESVVPGIARSRIDLVDAGIIFSWGASDISDPNSTLHERSDVGLRSRDGYHSIDTGKLTCAPLFAQQLLDAMH